MDSMGGSFGAGGLTAGSSATYLGIGSSNFGTVNIGNSNTSNSYTLTTANSYKN